LDAAVSRLDISKISLTSNCLLSNTLSQTPIWQTQYGVANLINKKSAGCLVTQGTLKTDGGL